MITTSDQFQQVVRGSHVLDVVATAYPPVGDPFDLPLEQDAGEVVIDRTADHRRTCTLNVADPSLYPVQPDDPLNVYGTEFIIWRGVRLGSFTERVQLGVFRIEDIQVDTPSGAAVITGYDRSRQVFDQRFLKPRKFEAMTGVALISQLITEVYADAVIHVLTSDATTIPKHHVDRDRWAECLRVANVIGCEVYANNLGEWVIQDIPDITATTPVYLVNAGDDGVLVSLNDEVTRESAPNIVVAIGESVSGNNGPFYGIARDDNPLSPTYYLGAYGKVPRFFSSQYIRTQPQADRVAAHQLREHLGISRTVSFTAVPNPSLEAGDTVRVVRPNGSHEDHFIDTFTIPLSGDGDIEGETRAVDWNAD